MRQFEQLPSTNDYACQLLEQGHPEEGTVVVADHQTAGKGQRGNSWEVLPGCNLTLSVIFYPRFLCATQAFLLAQMAALAVRDMLASYLPASHRLQLKWPNDVLIDGKKVAGILIHNHLSGSKMQASVVGIGCNVNQTAFPPHLPHAASLASFTGHPFPLDELRGELYGCLERRYLQLKTGQVHLLRRDYLASLYGYQERRTFRLPNGRTFAGIVAGVQENGKLIVDTAAGRHYFDLKEVAFADWHDRC